MFKKLLGIFVCMLLLMLVSIPLVNALDEYPREEGPYIVFMGGKCSQGGNKPLALDFSGLFTDEKNIYAYDNLNEQKSSMPSNIDGPWVYYGSLHGLFFIRGFYDLPAIRNGMGDLHILSHKKLTISGYEIIYDYWDGHIEEIRPISFSTKATSLDCFPFIGICRLGIITGITTHIDVWVIE